MDAEEDFELRAAFGEGATVVNVLTGEVRAVGKPKPRLNERDLPKPRLSILERMEKENR
jgi:hypothetical protein